MAKSGGSIWVSLGLKTDQFSKGVSTARGKLGKFKKETSALEKGMRGLGGAIAGAFAISSVSSFFSSSLQAYDEQIQAQKKLENALGFTSSALEKQASALQGVTRYGDEATMQMQAQLATLGLTEDQIFKLTPLVQDLAAQTGKPLSKAAKEVTSALSTGSTTLAKYGVELTATNSLSENLELTLNGLQNSVGGAAEKMANEGMGGVEQLNNAYGDFKESVGRVISEGLKPLVPALLEATNAMKTLADDETLSWWEKLGGLINSSAGAAMVNFNKQLVSGVNAANTLKGTINNTKITVTNLKAAYDSGSLSLDEYKAALKRVGAAAKEKINTFKPLKTEVAKTSNNVKVLTKSEIEAAQKAIRLKDSFQELSKHTNIAQKPKLGVDALRTMLDKQEKEVKKSAESSGNTYMDTVASVIGAKSREKKTPLAIPVTPKLEVTAGVGQEVSKNPKWIEMGQEIGGVIGDGLKAGVVGGFASIGEAMGAALASGDVAAVGQAFMMQVADIVQGIGEQMISLGVTAVLAKKALDGLFANPGLAIAAGVALVTVASMMRNLLSQGAAPQEFADGGIISGPTLGLMGEYSGARSNPEVVAPLDKLKNLIGDTGAGGMSEVKFRIEGNELVGILNRTSKTMKYSR